MSRLIITWVLAVVFVALVLSRLRNEAPVFAAPGSHLTGETRTTIDPVNVDAIREIASSPVTAEATSQEADTSDSPLTPTTEVGRGFVIGKVFDIDAQPISKARLSFMRDGRLGGSTSSDNSGDYRIELREGPWEMYYRDRASSGDTARLLVGKVNVLPGQEIPMDVAVYGNRSLKGGFYRTEDSEFNLSHEVELRSTSDPSRLVAWAFCVTDREERKNYEQALAQRKLMDDKPVKELAYPPGMGYFEMTGLEPDIYELKVFLDVGKQFYVSMEVDLTQEEEVAFAPVPLEQSQFLNYEKLVF